MEQTFAWLWQNRRFKRDYERLRATSETLVYAPMGRLMLRRLAPPRQQDGSVERRAYSHSMVPGGLEVTSYTTRFTSGTSLTMRLESLASRS